MPLCLMSLTKVLAPAVLGHMRRRHSCLGTPLEETTPLLHLELSGTKVPGTYLPISGYAPSKSLTVGHYGVWGYSKIREPARPTVCLLFCGCSVAHFLEDQRTFATLYLVCL